MRYKFRGKRLDNGTNHMKPIVEYRRSPKGLLTNLYSKMKERSKKKGLPDVNFTLQEFHQMFIHSDNYKRLYKQWVDSDFDQAKRPSIDRDNPDYGYSRDNIKLMTWAENRKKGDKENAERITTAVVMFDFHGKKIREFESVKEAVKETGLNQGLIVMCCQGKRNHTGGYVFKYRGDKFRKRNIHDSELLEG